MGTCHIFDSVVHVATATNRQYTEAEGFFAVGGVCCVEIGGGRKK